MGNTIFISHISAEGPVATVLASILAEATPSITSWESGSDIASGRQWLASIDGAMREADVVVVLCSRRSIAAPWVNFEAGGGWGRDGRVVPVCHVDLELADLPDPLRAFQAHQLTRKEHLVGLLENLGCTAADVDGAWAQLERAWKDVAYVPEAARPVGVPKRARGLLIDESHGQAEWPWGRPGTIFEWVHEEPSWSAELDVDVRALDAVDQFRARDLEAWAGLILALPLRNQLTPSVIEEIVTWVRAGGRLLLLGFELGDLHHGGNLNDLAARFALRFGGDIVAPKGATTGAKPYDEDVSLTADGRHPLLEGVREITWRNLQTIAREPGTIPIVELDPEHAIAGPTPETVRFIQGGLAMPDPSFRFVPGNGAIVAAQATRHLTGRGRVVAVGTWDLLPDTSSPADNERFATNLVRWLVADPESSTPSAADR